MLDPKKLRRQVNVMRSEEAVEFLLGLFDGDQAQAIERVSHILENSKSRVSKKNAALLVFFWDRLEKYCRTSEVEEFLYGVLGRDVSKDACRTAIKRVRAFIREEGYPIRLDTAYGVGYRLRLLNQKFDLFSLQDRQQKVGYHSKDKRFCVPFGVSMKGDVNAYVVEIAGELTGDVVADTLIMRPGARLVGNAQVSSVVIKEGDAGVASMVPAE